MHSAAVNLDLLTAFVSLAVTVTFLGASVAPCTWLSLDSVSYVDPSQGHAVVSDGPVALESVGGAVALSGALPLPAEPAVDAPTVLYPSPIVQAISGRRGSQLTPHLVVGRDSGGDLAWWRLDISGEIVDCLAT